jgi:hypothetical protein
MITLIERNTGMVESTQRLAWDTTDNFSAHRHKQLLPSERKSDGNPKDEDYYVRSKGKA